MRVIQNKLRKYEYRVRWDSYWLAEPEYSVFATFEDDLDSLKLLIKEQ